MTPPVPPEDDIGPFYKTLGLIVTGLMAGLVVIARSDGQRFDWFDIGALILFGMLLLALIRPRKFDEAMKTIADRLSFFTFRKDKGPDAGE